MIYSTAIYIYSIELDENIVIQKHHRFEVIALFLSTKYDFKSVYLCKIHTSWIFHEEFIQLQN